mmetsp:Transcript_27798/g.63052  ORF Transcript_27798/g.63052 Transcript_27798/m.63052 type:complete len:88 (+) Transcript_27798:1501-1764(+)
MARRSYYLEQGTGKILITFQALILTRSVAQMLLAMISKKLSSIIIKDHNTGGCGNSNQSIHDGATSNFRQTCFLYPLHISSGYFCPC